MWDLLDPLADPVDAVSDSPESASEPIDPIDPVVDLIHRNEAEIASAEAWLTALNQQVTAVKRLLGELNQERSSLVAMARRTGIEPPAGRERAQPWPDWTDMPRVEAVQQVLRDAARPLHLQEIEAVLRSHGRTNDDVSLVSATLAYLKRRRASVASMGGGCWRATSTDAPEPPAAVTPPRAVPSLSDF